MPTVPFLLLVLSVINKPAIVTWSRDLERKAVRSQLCEAIRKGEFPVNETGVIELLGVAQEKADNVRSWQQQVYAS